MSEGRYKADTVAKYIVRKYNQKRTFINVSALQKVLFLADRAYEAAYGTPLVLEEVETAKGHVCIQSVQDLYESYDTSHIPYRNHDKVLGIDFDARKVLDKTIEECAVCSDMVLERIVREKIKREGEEK